MTAPTVTRCHVCRHETAPDDLARTVHGPTCGSCRRRIDANRQRSELERTRREILEQHAPRSCPDGHAWLELAAGDRTIGYRCERCGYEDLAPTLR